LETIEVKLEVGLGSVTKSVVAMCLSNLTADVQNWSSDVITFFFISLHFNLIFFSFIQMSLQSTINIEAALFNERVLAWEPLIEPTLDSGGTLLSSWCMTCSIVPVSISLMNC
jgi:hypothetical protein